jgi:hypothetical protein
MFYNFTSRAAPRHLAAALSVMLMFTALYSSDFGLDV